MKKFNLAGLRKYRYDRINNYFRCINNYFCLAEDRYENAVGD